MQYNKVIVLVKRMSSVSNTCKILWNQIPLAPLVNEMTMALF